MPDALRRVLVAFSLAALTCLVGFSSFASDVPAPEADLQQAQIVDVEAAETVPPVSQDLSQYYTPAEIDEIEQIFGNKPIAMCGAYCAHNPSNLYCTRTCGDFAGCLNGYCIYF